MTSLPTPCVCLITDRRVAGSSEALVRAVDLALAGGIDVVQLREKGLSTTGLTSLARRLRDITAGRALLIVNGSLEVALAVEADGVHLPEDAMSIAQAQRPPSLLIGRSMHSVNGAVAAVRDGTDYVQAGAVFATESHPGAASAGLSLIESMTAAVSMPVVGVGGVTHANTGAVIAAGAGGVAVIRAVLAAPDPRAAAQALRQAVDAAWAQRAVQAIR
jgi:thiamine-phosphate pyrophosphorylase